MSPTSPNSPQVLIIGGGFAGPVLALALKSRNITSAIYDLRPEGDQHGGNISLGPNGLRVLDIVGVYDKLRVSGYSYEEVHLSNHKGVHLGKFLNGSQAKYNYQAVRVHRRDIRDILLARVKEEGIPMYYNMKFKSIVEETEDSVTVAFEDGTQVKGDFAIGCDGIHSRVRQAIHPDSKPIFQDSMALVGTVFPDQLSDIIGPAKDRDSNRWPVKLPVFIIGETGLFGYLPADFAGTQFGFMTSQRAHARTRQEWDTFEQDKVGLKEAMESAFLSEKGGSDYPPEARLLLQRAKPETMHSWPFFVVPETEMWFSHKTHSRVVFLGDAAHGFKPTGGQGSSMAFEDAATLALTLSRVYHPNPMPDLHTRAPVFGRKEILERWSRHRQDRVRRVSEFTARNGELMSSAKGYWNQFVKEWAIWATLWWQGPSAGTEWLYSYHCESVLAALAS